MVRKSDNCNDVDSLYALLYTEPVRARHKFLRPGATLIRLGCVRPESSSYIQPLICHCVIRWGNWRVLCVADRAN